MKKPLFGFARFKKLASKLPIQMPISTAVAIAAAGLLSINLISLVPYSAREHATQLGSATLSAIKHDVTFAPVKVLQIAILKFTENDAYIRFASVAAAIAASWLLYVMLRKWHTQRVSLLTVALFMTSTYYLQQGRSANLDILYLCVIPALLLISMWLISKKSNTKLPLAAILLGLTLYIPGSWLFILAGGLFLRKSIVKTISQLRLRIGLLSAAAFIATAAPLVYGLATSPQHIVRLLGFNTNQTFSISEIGSRTVTMFDELFYRGINDPAVWLPGTPIFDIFTIAMIALGLYAYRAGLYASREKLVFGSIIVAILLIIIGNVATLGLLIPILYILVANGLSYMLQSWFTVFPRNPVARSLGITILTVVIIGACSFQLYRYFVAWPQAAATTKALTTQQ